MMKRMMVGIMAVLMIASIFTMIGKSTSALHYGPPNPLGNGWYGTDYWNITGDTEFNGSDYDAYNIMVNYTLKCENGTIVFRNITNFEIGNLSITNATVKFINVSAITIKDTLYLNATIEFYDSTLYLNPDVKYPIITANISSMVFENSTAHYFRTPCAIGSGGIVMPFGYNQTIFINNSKIYFDDYVERILSPLGTGYILSYEKNMIINYSTFTAINSELIAPNNYTVLIFGEDVYQTYGHYVNLTIDNCIVKNIGIITMSAATITDSEFSMPGMYYNATMIELYLNASYYPPAQIFLVAQNGTNAMITGNTFTEEIFTLMVMPYDIHTNNATVLYQDNSMNKTITGVFYMGKDSNSVIYNITFDIIHNVFDKVGTNMALSDVLGDFYIPSAIAFIGDHGTFQKTTIERNDFKGAFNAITILMNSTDLPKIEYNYIHDYKIAFIYGVNNTTALTLGKNWIYREGLKYNETNWVHVNSTDELEYYYKDAMLNGTIYELLTTINITDFDLTDSALKFPMANITIEVKKGWNFIGIPFAHNLNLTTLFDLSKDITAAVFISPDRDYIYVHRDYLKYAHVDFEWTSVYLYFANNTSIKISNPTFSEFNKITLHEGWNNIPYVLYDVDFIQALNQSGVKSMVIRMPDGNYTYIDLNITPPETIENIMANITVGQAIYVYAESETTVIFQSYAFKELFPDETPPSF